VERVCIIGFTGDAPSCGDRASSWELVRCLNEVWPDTEPFGLDTLGVEAAAHLPDVVRRADLVILQGAAAAAPPVVPAAWQVNFATPAEAAEIVPDTAILTDPLEHGSLAEELERHDHFIVAAGGTMPPGEQEAFFRTIRILADRTGLLPVVVPGGGPNRQPADDPLATASPPWPAIPEDMPYPAVAHLAGRAAFVVGGDRRVSLLAAIGGTPSLFVAAADEGLTAVGRMLGCHWPVRPCDAADLVVADAIRLRAARPQARQAVRSRAAELRLELRARVRGRLAELRAGRPPGAAHLAPPAPPVRTASRILAQLLPITLYLRRGLRPEASFRCLRQLVEGELAAVLRQLDSRWLVSICDSYADHGDPVSSRNALLISTFVTWERLAATHALWDRPDRGTLRVEGPPPADNLPLWDGLLTVHLRRGDTVNNLLVRSGRLLADTPHLLAIWRELLSRIRSHDTLLAALDRPHGHLFEENLDWMADPDLDGVPRWRRPALPPGSAGP